MTYPGRESGNVNCRYWKVYHSDANDNDGMELEIYLRNLWIYFLRLFILSFKIFSRVEIRLEDLFEIVIK